MEQFVAVAAAHAVALLVPGVDFFLIARTAMIGGWRPATGACVGIAAANGVFIAAAFSGLALVRDPVVLGLIQLAGGCFLLTVGVAFLRSPAQIDLATAPSAGVTTWWRTLGLGLGSGLLNPKNALFYVSLAAAVGDEPAGTLVAYGAWMFLVVLLWDIVVALVLGTRRALARMERLIPILTRVAGAVLALLGGGMLVRLAAQMLAP